MHSPSKNATSTSTLPHNHKSSSELLNREFSNFKVNSSLRVAESRLFPVGTPDLIPSHSNLVSPFDVSTFGKQLLPLINVNIKEKVKDIANTFNSGADYIEDAIREGWRESPLNPHNFKNLLDGPNLLKHLPFAPRKPVVLPTSHHAKAPHKEKAPKAVEPIEVDGFMHDYGINGYKHFEDSILREIEKQEELKVEATIHTLFEQGDRVRIVHGKPYDFASGWKPVAAPTKNYDDSNEIHSQIISPLHTSIFDDSSEDISSNDIVSGFHDFDNLNSNTIHSTYSVHEEAGESKNKPVKARITPVRKFTPSQSTTQHSHRYVTASTQHTTRFAPTESSRVNSRYRKRHNNDSNKPVSLNSIVVADVGASASHDAPKVVNKSKRNPQRIHIQSLTTTKPKTNWLPSRNVISETPKPEIATDNVFKSSYTYHGKPDISVPAVVKSTYSFDIDYHPRTRSSTVAPTTTTTRKTTTWTPRTTTTATARTTKTTTTTTTTVKPSRNVPREVAKFVDKAKATGYRGSVKFGQTTTKKPL